MKVVIYDNQMEKVQETFLCKTEEEFNEHLSYFAAYWSDTNHEGDYREYLAEKYGNDFYPAKFSEEEDEFFAYMQKRLEDPVEYIEDCGFSIIKS